LLNFEKACKKLLYLFIALPFLASAQLNTSFEAAEGFTLNPINGQNGWLPAFGADSEISTLSVANNRATMGTNSLKFTSDGSNWDFYDGVLTPQIPSVGNNFEVSFDFYPDSDEDSDHVFYSLQGTTLTFASVLIFDYLGNINARVGTTAASNVGTYTAGQWYNIKIVFNYTASTVTYFVNNAQVLTGPTMGTSTGVSQLFFGYDNYGSGYNIDNVKLSSTLATNQFNSSSLNIYPNPTTDILNISSKSNSNLQSLEVLDLNGRVIKSQRVNGISSELSIAEFSAGVYLLKVISDEGSITQKIIKK
jgi:hypothetical protein